MSTPKQQNDWVVRDNIAVYIMWAVVEPAVVCWLEDRCMRGLDCMREAILASVVVSQAHVLNASVHLFLRDKLEESQTLRVSGCNELLRSLIKDSRDAGRDLRGSSRHVNKLNPDHNVCMKGTTMLNFIPYDIVVAVAEDAILMEDVLTKEVLDALEEVS